ncbi:tRNA 2-thiouridine(34) synthase MnmA [uncultured Desulfosarcina sp.]|uniref:tRNA 2-thiouridine(34) synthase MnmA n=1 Tax=uncultured Desulfosarcina sp. TaxID=218289 RepID=UPI0029C7F5F8|nr:tRNA 2-thiouridine(34) synthase MnmA [uncultured Desulfosarcina sp.]
MTGPIAIALSGGIDSLVAAYLLKKQAKEIFGFHFLTGFEKPCDPGPTQIQALFQPLDIPVQVVDLKAQFRKTVVDYFAAAYQNGETPNPCLVCNPTIKFGVLLQKAIQLGATHLATGHYARADMGASGRYRLLKGVDGGKDQSYFLARLTQDQLSRACFPLGTWTKDQVRALAEEKELAPVARSESQDVCFVRDSSYADFLVETAGMVPRPGEIVDTQGRRVGAHEGLHRYTIGQRRGINCPASRPYYVIRIDTRRNRLVVGFKEERYTSECRVRNINWIVDVSDGPLAVDTRIRYRHRAAASTVTPDEKGGATVRFDEPQSSVTPGQGAVFYRGEEVVGGGWIQTADS